MSADVPLFEFEPKAAGRGALYSLLDYCDTNTAVSLVKCAVCLRSYPQTESIVTFAGSQNTIHTSQSTSNCLTSKAYDSQMWMSYRSYWKEKLSSMLRVEWWQFTTWHWTVVSGCALLLEQTRMSRRVTTDKSCYIPWSMCTEL